jgi:hypothetical protein
LTTISTTPLAAERSVGRGYFWAGLGVCLLGLVLAVIQFSLKQLFVPWYTPALATGGTLLLLVAVARRLSVVRVVALVLVAAVAALQWFVLVVLMKLPAYGGPEAGEHLPAFRTVHADGRPFTEADLRDGSWRVLVFFRGRW